MFQNWSWNEYKAAGRHVANSAASGIAGALAWGLLTQGDASSLTDGVQHMASGLEELAKGVALVAGVLVPLYTTWKAKRSASPTAQTAAVVAALEASPAVATTLERADRNKLIDAVGKMPEVRRIVAAPEIARATASPKVVAVEPQLTSNRPPAA